MWFSPAKLNLGLRIVGRRSNGYHELESLFWPIRFGDDLIFESSVSSEVSCDWADDAPFKETSLFQNERNLVGKLLLGELGWAPKQNLKVQIKKRIPIGSGLGGVSSNAGTVLKYLTETKQLTLHESEMFAKQLGADVPFFLNPVPSWVTGIGEIRTPICFRPEIKSQLCFLLVLFPFPTSTPSLFQKYRDLSLPFSPPLKLDLTETWNFGSMVQFLKSTQNDLESLVASHSDPIHKALKSLRSSSPLYAGLSGTGSTCFAVFSSEKERADAAKELQAFCRDLNCRCVFAETY